MSDNFTIYKKKITDPQLKFLIWLRTTDIVSRYKMEGISCEYPNGTVIRHKRSTYIDTVDIVLNSFNSLNDTVQLHRHRQIRLNKLRDIFMEDYKRSIR